MYLSSNIFSLFFSHYLFFVTTSLDTVALALYAHLFFYRKKNRICIKNLYQKLEKGKRNEKCALLGLDVQKNHLRL